MSDTTATTDPRHVFLDATAVMARYGWGKTRGYQNLKDRDLVPPPVMVHPDRWRLDQLLTWEDRRIAAATVSSTRRSSMNVLDLLPPPKQRGRRHV